jgi:hypothetical protein
MSANEQNKAAQLQQQAQVLANEYQTNMQIALKPYIDLNKAFLSFVQTMNLVVAEKDREIQQLKNQLLQAANKDVPKQ